MSTPNEPPPNQILPAEYVGEAAHDADGILRIGQDRDVVQIRLNKGGHPGWWIGDTVSVYVRRMSDDLSVAEILMVCHDGLIQEVLDAQNAEAARYPLGAKEYWRQKMVGIYDDTQGGHPMTDDEFEEWWAGC